MQAIGSIVPVFVYNDWYLEKLILTKEYIQISEYFDFQKCFFFSLQAS